MEWDSWARTGAHESQQGLTPRAWARLQLPRALCQVGSELDLLSVSLEPLKVFSGLGFLTQGNNCSLQP